MMVRMLHDQVWITLSRHRTAKGKNRIVDKGIEFEQVDRESNWLVCGLLSLPFHHNYFFIILYINKVLKNGS